MTHESHPDTIILQPVHLGTGEQGRKRRAMLERMAAEAGYFWNGRPSIGRWLVAIADKKSNFTHTRQEEK